MRSSEMYYWTQRALLSLLSRASTLADAAAGILDDLEYEYGVHARKGRGSVKRARVERVVRYLERKQDEISRLLDELEAWSPEESVCYDEFKSRIGRITRALDRAEELINKLKSEVGVVAG